MRDKDYKFDTINSLARYICIISSVSLKNDIVDVVAHYDIIKELIEELIKINVKIRQIDITEPDWNGYNDEYILELCDGYITVEKAKRENGYFYADEYVLVHKNVSKDFYERNNKIKNSIKVFTIKDLNTDNYECDYNCCDCNKIHYELGEKLEDIKLSDDLHTISYENCNNTSYCKKEYYTSSDLSYKEIKDFIDSLY